MACRLEEGLDLLFAVEAGVVHDDDAGLGELGEKFFLEPLVDDWGVTGVFEEHGGEPFFVALSHDEVLGFTVGGRDVAEDFLPS